MNKKRIFSAQTRTNILLDMSLFVSGLVTGLSGIYFLFLPSGGYQGGRNSLYDITIFFECHTWGDIHTWASIIIITLAALHIPLHWGWIIKMTQSGFRSLVGKRKLNNYSQFNLAVNILVGLSGLICGLSGLYFLLVSSVSQTSLLGDSGWIFSRLTWDLIHTWSGVVMIAAAVFHFGIHWKWVVKVIGKYWRTLIISGSSHLPDQTVSLSTVQAKDQC
jgi:hypothetical protein